MKPIAVGGAIVALALCLYVGDYDRADAKLGVFYTQVLSANFIGARESIEEAIKLWPSSARYYGWRAYLTSQNLPPRCTHGLRAPHSALGAADESAIHLAMADYNKALGLNSRDAVAYHNLGWLEHLLGDDAVAAMDWKAAAEVDPANAVFHLSYGMFLDEIGNKMKAKEEFQNAIELSPSTVDSPFFMRYQIRDPDSAVSVLAAVISALRRKLEQGNDPIVEAKLGKLCLSQGDLSLATSLLEDAARQLPNLSLVWMNLGEVREKQGRLVDAMDCYKRANVVDGSLAGPFLRMGELELRNSGKAAASGNFSQAIEHWQRIKPVTAAHNSRLYVDDWQRIDDLLPTTLVWYTTPCEASRAWRGLSQLYPQTPEYAARSQTCESLPSPHTFVSPSEGFKP